MAADAPPPRTKIPLSRQLTRLWTQLGTARLVTTLLMVAIAVLLARLSWGVPLLGDAERALYDARATVMAPRVEQDPRILLVTYVDETLFNTGIRSPVDRAILTRALANIDRMGAKAIGIDIAFDSPRPEDPALQAQLRAMQTPTWLAYAEQASNPNTIQFEQQKFLEAYLAAVRTDKTRPASVRFRTDEDGTMRRWPDRPAHLPPMLANAMAPVDPAHREYQGAVRFHLPLRAEAGAEEPVFAEIPIDSFGAEMDAATLAGFAPLVAGRHVLIGGNIIGNDQFETPLSRLPDLQSGERETMFGMAIHAHMLRQQLNGDWPKPLPSASLWAAALLIVLAGGLTSMVDARASVIAAALGLQLAAFLALPFWLHGRGTDTLNLPAFGWALGWLVGYAAVGSAARTVGARQRAFAQSALGKYLPRDIAAEILRDPDSLALHGEKREIFCVFTDLEGFTKLSHAVTPETVARLLNAYLDRLSEVVLAHGGTIDKFVGDAVVAFWGAPISRTDDGERAARAARAMYDAGEAFRRDLGEGVPPIGMTRVGLHFGDAIVGNFGGEGRFQYTALGDSMNTAARLESANKQLKSRVLISREAATRCGRDDLIPMGRITLRGRSRPVEVFEPRPDLTPEQRAQIAAVVTAHDSGDKTALVTQATALRSAFGQDHAIMSLLERLDHTAKGESYALS
jgi:adenylate cyclase